MRNPDLHDLSGVEVGQVICIGGFLLGILASTVWVLNTSSVIRIVGLGFILSGIGACGYVMDSTTGRNRHRR